MSGTIKDNILFSHHYDETFYNLVLDGERRHPNNNIQLKSDPQLVHLNQTWPFFPTVT